jgi:hypothetical protein
MLMGKGGILHVGKKPSWSRAVKPTVLVILGMFFSMAFILALIGAIPIEDRQGNAVELSLWTVILLIMMFILTFCVAILGVIELVQVRNQLRIYELGILFSKRTLGEIIRMKEPFVPFDRIEKIYVNEVSESSPFKARTRKGPCDGKRKEQYRQIAKRLGNRLDIAVVLEKSGGVSMIHKDEIDDFGQLIEILNDKTVVDTEEFFFV